MLDKKCVYDYSFKMGLKGELNKIINRFVSMNGTLELN